MNAFISCNIIMKIIIVSMTNANSPIVRSSALSNLAGSWILTNNKAEINKRQEKIKLATRSILIQMFKKKKVLLVIKDLLSKAI